jgi:hypothetical protein
LFTPGASPARRTFERRSAPGLLWLHQLPAWLPPMLAAALLVTGLAVPGIAGAVALCTVAAGLAWLAALSWPRLSPAGRALRVGVVVAILAFAAARLLG